MASLLTAWTHPAGIFQPLSIRAGRLPLIVRRARSGAVYVRFGSFASQAVRADRRPISAVPPAADIKLVGQHLQRCVITAGARARDEGRVNGRGRSCFRDQHHTYQMREARRVHLGHDMRSVDFHRASADSESVRNRFIGLAGNEALQNLVLPY